MDNNRFDNFSSKTPSLVVNEDLLHHKLSYLQNVAENLNFKVLFPVKSMSTAKILYLMMPYIDGFAVSSLNEASLLNDVFNHIGAIHYTSPALKAEELLCISELCDCIIFNSISQLERYGSKIEKDVKSGLRVNPGLPFVYDDRFNPCQNHSKLGASLHELNLAVRDRSNLVKKIKGLLFHTNCESEDFRELLDTVKHIDQRIPDVLKGVNWINIGGGYLFDEGTDWDPFEEAVSLLRDKYNLEIFFEPGKGIIGEAGYIVSTVLDIFESDRKKVAILDTTVNHMTEVFEYQYKPSVMQEAKDGQYKYILAGASCLAGDLFGEYSFDKPLEVGTRLIFEDMGAYTFVKANMFNGINLPSIYILRSNGELELVREFGYQDYLSICGAKKNETLRKRDPITSHIWSNELT